MMEKFFSSKINKKNSCQFLAVYLFIALITLGELYAQESELLKNCGRSSLGANGLILGYNYNGSNEFRLGYGSFYFCPNLRYKSIFSVEIVSQFNHENSLGLNVNYHKNRFFRKSLPILLGINLASISNFESIDVVIRPEIGINFPKNYKTKSFPIVFFYYGYNGYFINNSEIKNRYHQFIFRMLIPWIKWKS